jgi:predicted nucleic acid-binding protein
VDAHSDALRIVGNLCYSILDAIIGADCHTLWSENKQHGAVIDGRLRIANPL